MSTPKKVRWRDLGYSLIAATLAMPFVFYAVRSLQVNIYVDTGELSALVDALIDCFFSWFAIIALWLGLRWLYVTIGSEATTRDLND